MKLRLRIPRLRRPRPMDIIKVNGRYYTVRSIWWQDGHSPAEAELEELDETLARRLRIGDDAWTTLGDVMLEAGWRPPSASRNKFRELSLGELQCLVSALSVFDHEWVGLTAKLLDEATEALGGEVYIGVDVARPDALVAIAWRDPHQIRPFEPCTREQLEEAGGPPIPEFKDPDFFGIPIVADETVEPGRIELRTIRTCPAGDACALNRGAVHCNRCGRNWPPDGTWYEPTTVEPGKLELRLQTPNEARSFEGLGERADETAVALRRQLRRLALANLIVGSFFLLGAAAVFTVGVLTGPHDWWASVGISTAAATVASIGVVAIHVGKRGRRQLSGSRFQCRCWACASQREELSWPSYRRRLRSIFRGRQ